MYLVKDQVVPLYSLYTKKKGRFLVPVFRFPLDGGNSPLSLILVKQALYGVLTIQRYKTLYLIHFRKEL